MFRTLTMLLALALCCFTQTTARADSAKLNGLEMYYEVHGQGEPLVLIHGAYNTIESNWGKLIPTFAKTHKVIAMELQAHGRTSDAKRPLSCEGMADDVAALLKKLKIGKAAVFGYSMGAAVAIRLAMQHPALVSRLIAASGSISSDAFPPGFDEMIASITPEMFAGTPFEAAYLKVAPNKNGFPNLVAKLKELDLKPFSWSEKDFAKIAVPTLLIYGDADVISLDHAVKLHKLLGGKMDGDTNGLPKSTLLILPATSHTGVVLEERNLALLRSVVPTFLTQQLPRAPQF